MWVCFGLGAVGGKYQDALLFQAFHLGATFSQKNYGFIMRAPEIDDDIVVEWLPVELLFVSIASGAVGVSERACPSLVRQENGKRLTAFLGGL